jgi:hypothetical protein
MAAKKAEPSFVSEQAILHEYVTPSPPTKELAAQVPLVATPDQTSWVAGSIDAGTVSGVHSVVLPCLVPTIIITHCTEHACMHFIPSRQPSAVSLVVSLFCGSTVRVSIYSKSL